MDVKLTRKSDRRQLNCLFLIQNGEIDSAEKQESHKMRIPQIEIYDSAVFFTCFIIFTFEQPQTESLIVGILLIFYTIIVFHNLIVLN